MRRSLMNTISIPAHFDGIHILLDEPYPLKPDTKLLVTVLPEKDEERETWLHVSAQRLADAFADDEPEYPLSSVREMNPSYDRG
jgi:hypothetical protein